MTIPVIITFCLLLLMAYLFDLSSSKTRIPSVILLLLLGWVVRQGTELLNFRLPDISAVLPFLGTIGLILIVLEGSLELELNRSKTGLIRKSLLGALLPMIASAFLLAYLFRYFGDYTMKESLANAIPLCIISSAIAIPSVRSLNSRTKEFVIYESSFSDILGVLFFNIITLNEVYSSRSPGYFIVLLLVIIAVSFGTTIGLSFLLSKIEHHIKFVPIILLVILIFAVSKIYHLPGLLFILLFGLFIGNLEGMRQYKWLEQFRPDLLKAEVKKFKELTIEATFLVRSLFFLVFGFLMETSEILNTKTLFWSVGIVIITFVLRAIQLKLSRLPLRPLLFIAPRGLITILLFLSIDPENQIPIVNRPLIIQVIIITALIMMAGLMVPEKKTPAIPENGSKPEENNEPTDSPS